VLHVRGDGGQGDEKGSREWRDQEEEEGDGKPLLKCSKWPWVSIAPGCFHCALRKWRRKGRKGTPWANRGKAHALPLPPVSSARRPVQRSLLPSLIRSAMDGRELRAFAHDSPLSARENTRGVRISRQGDDRSLPRGWNNYPAEIPAARNTRLWVARARASVHLRIAIVAARKVSSSSEV